ncbi:MAG: hypothetical protein ACRDP4_06810 [Nocardioidaceae bacterium]
MAEGARQQKSDEDTDSQEVSVRLPLPREEESRLEERVDPPDHDSEADRENLDDDYEPL